MPEIAIGTLVRVRDSNAMKRFSPHWAGQLAIVVGTKGRITRRLDRVSIRRLHDGAEEWWYTYQLEIPEEQTDADR